MIVIPWWVFLVGAFLSGAVEGAIREWRRPRTPERATTPATVSDVDEIDRNARAYGWEIGRGQIPDTKIRASEGNPFLRRDWRETIGKPR